MLLLVIIHESRYCSIFTPSNHARWCLIWLELLLVVRLLLCVWSIRTLAGLSSSIRYKQILSMSYDHFLRLLRHAHSLHNLDVLKTRDDIVLNSILDLHAEC